MAEIPNAYPATLSIDYPDRPLNRLTTFFRLFTIIPIAIIFVLIGLSIGGSGGDEGSNCPAGAGAAIVSLPIIFMLLFRQKYPRWWFDWNLAITRFSYRIGAYFALLRDEYPSTDEEQAVHLEIPYPEAKELNRWLPLVKWLLAIPHYIILFFLCIAAILCVIFAWFVILFTGVYPRAFFNFIVGVSRWELRVTAYAFLLTTDRYPPFALSE